MSSCKLKTIFGKLGSTLKSFSAHYATSLCFLYLSAAAAAGEGATSTVSWQNETRNLLWYFDSGDAFIFFLFCGVTVHHIAASRAFRES